MVVWFETSRNVNVQMGPAGSIEGKLFYYIIIIINIQKKQVSNYKNCMRLESTSSRSFLKPVRLRSEIMRAGKDEGKKIYRG